MQLHPQAVASLLSQANRMRHCIIPWEADLSGKVRPHSGMLFTRHLHDTKKSNSIITYWMAAAPRICVCSHVCKLMTSPDFLYRFAKQTQISDENLFSDRWLNRPPVRFAYFARSIQLNALHFRQLPTSKQNRSEITFMVGWSFMHT